MPRINHYKPPRPLAKGDWVLIQATEEKGIVETVMDDGERLLVRVPSLTDWPFPRWVHVPSDKVRRIRPKNPPKEKPEFEESPF